MKPKLIQCIRFKNLAPLPTAPVQYILMQFDILRRFQQLLVPLKRRRAIKAKIIRDSGPALAHAGRARAVRDVEHVTAAAGSGTERSPDGEAGDDVCGGVVEAGVVGGAGAGEGDAGAFAFDEGVEGEVGGPVSEEVVGAAVGDEADLVVMNEKDGWESWATAKGNG